MNLLRILQITFVVCMALLGSASTASADLATFAFEAVALRDWTPSFPFSEGQRIFGQYTFELNTPPETTPGDNHYTRYNDALTNFTVTVEGFGTGTGSAGDILLGDPVQTSGSFNFLSDQYVVQATASGITVPSPQGDRHLLSAWIRMADLDQEALSSEDLLPTPPPLALFLDNYTGAFDADNAEIALAFDFPDGGFNSAAFQLTSLTAVPEPDMTLCVLAILLGWLCRCGMLTRVRAGRQGAAYSSGVAA